MSTRPLPDSHAFTLSSALSTLRARWKTIAVSVAILAVLGIVFISLLPTAGVPVWRRPFDFTATLALQLSVPSAARIAAGFDVQRRAAELFENPENFARALGADLDDDALRQTMDDQFVVAQDRRAYRIAVDFFHDDPQLAHQTLSRLNGAVRETLNAQIDSRLRARDVALADSIAANEAIPWPAGVEPSVRRTPEPRLARSAPIGIAIFIAAGLIVGVLLAFLHEPFLRILGAARRRWNDRRARGTA